MNFSKDMTFHEFRAEFAEYLGLMEEELTEKTNILTDLGVDSLSLVNAIIRFEADNNIKFKAEERIMIQDLGRIYEIVINNLKAKEMNN